MKLDALTDEDSEMGTVGLLNVSSTSLSVTLMYVFQYSVASDSISLMLLRSSLDNCTTTTLPMEPTKLATVLFSTPDN